MQCSFYEYLLVFFLGILNYNENIYFKIITTTPMAYRI
jgi:hypothetical protein